MAGDLLQFDIDNHKCSIVRNGKPLVQENGDKGYYLMPSDGVEFQALASLIADVAGLHVREIGDENVLTYEFFLL